MALFKILKGLLARLPNASKLGYAYYTTDKGKFYIFNSETLRRTLNPDIKITIGNQTKTSTTLSPEVAFDLASIGAAAADHNHDNRYLKLSGGTMTGTITLLGNQSADSYSGALNANNSNIYGVNSIYTADLADTSAEGIHFYRTNTTVDSLWIKNGVIYFTPNRTLGKTGTDYTVIHSGNYTDYTVKKDGTGATGNWNININKNAATATKLLTSRSLWGNSFDGSSDVSGNITLKNGDQLNMQGKWDGFAFNYLDGKTTPQSTRFYDGQHHLIVRFASNGNVGIGTINPTSKLQVNGNSLFQGETVTRIVRPEETKKYSLGTGSWYFKEAFIDTVNGTNLYLRGQTANRLIWLNGSKMLDTTGHYVSGSKIAVNSTEEPGYNFYVNGTSYFVNNVGIAGYDANYKLYTNGKSLFNGDIYLTNKGALIIYGDTVGNDVNTLISKTVGVLSYGDTGPKIDFGTSATGNQRGAIIFTDHDAAGVGVSWHFVSNQTDWNVNSKRFVAKTSITIGQNLPNTNYNLYVNGSTYLNGILNVASTLQPTSTNTQTLGTSSLRWAEVYIGTADTYGSTTKGVYWNAGVPTAMTYELKSTVNNGIATSIAYYSGTNVVSSGSIVTNGSFLHNVSSLYVTKNDWVFDLGHNYTNQDAYLSADYGGIRIAFNTTNEGQTMTSIRPDSIYIGKKESDGDFHGTIWTDNASGSITANGSLWISQNNDTGGGIHLADDGGFYDFNNGYGTAAFSSGLIVARGKDQNNTAISLAVEGQGWAYSSSEAQFGVHCDSSGKNFYLYANGTNRGIFSAGVGSIILLHNDNIVHMYAESYHNRSDIRLKQNIFNLKLKLSVNFIRLLLPVKFQFKHTDKYCFGFIAQDVLKVMKNFNLKEKDYNLVTKPEFDPNHPENERYYNISYTELIAPTIKAVQYLDKLIEQNKQKEKELQQLILKLKSLIQLLNAKLDTLVVSHL